MRGRHARGRAVDLIRRWRARIVVAALLGAVAAGVFGAGTADRVTAAGGGAPASEAARAAAVPGSPVAAGNVALLYRSAGRTAADPRFAGAVRASLAAVPPALVREPPPSAARRVSRDGRAVLVVLRLSARDALARARAFEQVESRADVPALGAAGVRLSLGGDVAADVQITEAAADDLARVELLAFPLLLLMLVVVFRGFAAAALPLLLGGLSVAFSLAALRALTSVVEVSSLALNIVTMLGLGLAVDYALFVVSRFREELAGGADERTALARTCASAVRTVAVSGAIVMLSLAGLLCVPFTALRSVGIGGMTVVAINVAVALLVLPALLALLGRRVGAPGAGRRFGRVPRPDGTGPWARAARQVMRHPVAALAGAVAVLALAGAPFLHAQYGLSVTSMLPPGSPAQAVAESVEDDFPGAVPFAVAAVLPSGGAAGPSLGGYLAAVERVPGVDGAAPVASGRDGAVHVAIASRLEPGSEAARDVVRAVRDLPPPEDARVLVGGATAQVMDDLDVIVGALKWTLLIIVVSTGALLGAAFRSVVLPVKALAVAALSLTASLGVLVWGFQDGGLAPLGVPATGHLSSTTPILVLAVAFGLSVDYEMFLLSRVREEWLRTGDNTRAVAAGLQRTGGIITSAALLMMIVTGALATARVVPVAMVGVGLTVAIAVDATVVRLVLVPATMRLMGHRNWWFPFARRAVTAGGARTAARSEKVGA
ncbi:MMPL family transporter [Actinomadura algeriensis]|uniref:RND superfamily putative drug exporter n=1 Tax=Actinomadura algeriensis TaxID=1679523 RepID=A0ABR9K337_9ACTN|nr:MMPL family transporter [Actinomadura algeriensis]MBE1537259.1 RND superfamily putative drug exporter [Actinomadura algeriensis]